MQRSRCCIIAGLVLCAGCAAGPFEEIAWMNPVHRQEWAKDDHDVNNYHNRIQEYRKLASNLRYMPREKQDELTQDLALEFEHESDALFRVEIVRALGQSQSPAAEGGLRRAIKDPETTVRVAACDAWKHYGGESAGKLLSEALVGDSDRVVRIAAAQALGDLKDASTMRSIGLALEQDDPAMQYACTQSLKKISGKDYGSDLKAWRELADGGSPPEPPHSIAQGLKSLFR